VCVDRDPAVDQDPGLVAVEVMRDERAALPDRRPSELLDPDDRDEAEAVVQVGEVDIGERALAPWWSG
jgi:hypothetical protein